MAKSTEDTHTAVNAGDGTRIPKTPVRFLLHVSRAHKVWAFSAIIAVILAAGGMQATSAFFKFIVDAAENGDMATALLFGLLYPVAVFVAQLFYRISGYLGRNWITGVEKDTADTLVGYTIRHSHNYFIDRFSGSILSKTTNVIGAMGQCIPDFLWSHLTAVTSFIISYLLITSVDALSGLIFLLLIATLMVLNNVLAPRKKMLSRRAVEASTVLRGNIVDLFTNATAVRQYAHINRELRSIAKDTSVVKEANKKNLGYGEMMLTVNLVVLLFFAFAMFYVLIMRWEAGEITTGDFVFILALVSQLTGALLFIGRAFNNTAKLLGEAEEGLDELLLSHEIVDAPKARPLAVREGKIEWQEVNFEFESTKVFKDLSFTIEPGQRIGLVGPSGAGKTTFVSLLLRQHELMDGTITIDGQDIASVTQNSLRRAIAVVPQESLLFHRSIRDNIAYGKPRATKGEVIKAAKKAQAHQFVRALPQGYETLVGERGVKLSGGQRQRIAIARAMLKEAPILVLDEATSALDSESEVAIQKALHKLMEGKTVVAIAHRLSTLREMDRIIYLDNGTILEDGTHEELVKKNGSYAMLWKHQAGGFLQD